MMNNFREHSYLYEEVINMSAFLRRFIDNKKYIFLILTVMLVMGFLFGLFEYGHCQEMIKKNLQSLFYLNNEKYTNQYQLYIIQSGLYILICTYLSSSYLGHFGILFLTFLKGVQISFSLCYVFSIIQIDFLTVLLIIIEIILELILIFALSLMCFHLSLYVTLISYYIDQTFNMKNIINYRLNCLIATLIIFSLSLAFRVYVIPLF